MTKTKSTKRALLLSALSLLMCVSMLIGSTFAWFTDSVTSSGNKIKAGTLDIQLLMDADVDGTYEDISNSTSPIFGGDSIAQNNNAETLWEPGKTQVAYLAIKNNGNLALKYTVGLDVQNVSKDLYEVMEYAIVPDADANHKVTSWTSGNSVEVGTQSVSGDVSLPVGATHCFALVIHMDEEAGNEYQGGEVNFDLTVLATQDTVESDSFNNQYDKDAVYGDVMVSSDAELKAAIEDPAMKVIAVNGDLTYDWGSESYENSKALNMKGKTFLGANDAASITFAGYGSANPIVDATFRNITIKDSTVGDNEASWEHGYLEFKNLTAVNVTFANSIMMEGDFATFKNCSFNSNKDGEYAVWVANGDATFEGCTFTGPRGVKVHEAYGSEVGTVVIDNNTFAGLTQKPGVVIGTVDATTKVTIKNSTFVNCQAGDQGLYIYETDTDVTTFKFVNVNNTIATGVSNNTELKDAIAAGGNVVLGADVQFAATIKNDVAIDLAGNTFEATGSYTLGKDADFTMSNGQYVTNGTYGHVDVRPDTAEGSVITFEDIDFTTTKKNPTYGTCTDRLNSVVEITPNAAGAHVVAVFKNCTFDNAKVLFEGMSDKVGSFEATFENCTFNALTSSSPIEVMNYIEGTITVKNCTFNLECTSSSAAAICVSPSNSTAVTIIAENNTINAVAATPHTFDATAGETEVDNIKVFGTPANIKFISSDDNTTVKETNTVKTGIAG